MKINVAIVGASGLVGKKIIQVLDEEKLLKNVNLTLYVSEKSANEDIFINKKRYKLSLLQKSSLDKKFDVVFFSAGEEISKIWAKEFASHGAFVIDNSNAFRRKDTVPLVIPEINSRLINSQTKIIANPNCSTIQLALVINAIQSLGNIEKIVVSTYQSVSGAGKMALDDLKNQTKNEIIDGINDNVIVKIGNIEVNNFCEEENKIMFELNKILEKKYSVCASTARVPISFCHTESVYIKFYKNVKLEEIRYNIKQNNIIIHNDICLPKDIANTNETHVCRLRKFSDNEIVFFVIADNLRRGAAYNAVLIFKELIKMGLIKI